MKYTLYFKAALRVVYVHVRATLSDIKYKLTQLEMIAVYENYLHKIKKTRNTLQKEDISKSKIVLADNFPIPEWCIINGAIAEQINQEFNSIFKVFGHRAPQKNTVKEMSFLGQFTFLKIKLTFSQSLIRLKMLYKIFIDIKDADDVINFEIDSINVGLDVYESTLRLGYSTVNLSNIDLYKVFYQAITQYLFFKPMFESNHIIACLLSHDNYVGPGLVAKMAYKFKVPVILANPYEINIITKPFENYQRYQRYKEYFSNLRDEIKITARLESKIALQKRLTGKVGIGMNYQIKSAFENLEIPRQTDLTVKKKILILTHDYFDNPHGYSRLPFRDFWEWLKFLSKISLESDYEWYLKCHKDHSQIEMDETQRFTKENTRFKLIDANTSFHQLAAEGIDLALTCFGTVGHELPLLGIPVLNASYNPHIAYNFNIHAKSLEEYRNILLDSSRWKLDLSSFDELFEFYYVHYSMMHNEKFIFNDFSQYLKLTKSERINYLEINKGAIIKKTKVEFSDAVANKRKFSIEKCLPINNQDKFPNNFFIQ